MSEIKYENDAKECSYIRLRGALYRLHLILEHRNDLTYEIGMAAVESAIKEFRSHNDPSTITPALDAAIQDEIEHGPASIMAFIPPAHCTDKASCHSHGKCMYAGWCLEHKK